MSAPPLKQVVHNCQVKLRFTDEFAARAATQSRLQQLGWKDGLSIYRCPLCAGWHMTSRKGQPRYFRITDTEVYPTLTTKENA